MSYLNVRLLRNDYVLCICFNIKFITIFIIMLISGTIVYNSFIHNYLQEWLKVFLYSILLFIFNLKLRNSYKSIKVLKFECLNYKKYLVQ